MEIQQEIAFAHAQAQIGKELEVIVDGPDPEVPGWSSPAATPTPRRSTARCASRARRCGRATCRARVTGADGYDLLARTIQIR